MKCVGKMSGMYFSEEDSRVPCSIGGYLLKGMWFEDQDGWICCSHASIHLKRWPNAKSWLTDRIHSAGREVVPRP